MIMHYGENLRSIRQSKNISQEAMAKSLDMSQPSYSRIEQKKTLKDKVMDGKITSLLETLPADLLAFPRYSSSTPANRQHKKEFINTPLGMLTVLGGCGSFVNIIYQMCEGFCDGYGTTETTKNIVKYTAALGTICYVFFLVRQAKRAR